MDTTIVLVIAAIMSAAALWFSIRWLVRSSSRYRGTRIVTCPETKKPAIVEVDWLRASLTSTVGGPDIRLKECSRWPIKKQCGQECLMELDVAPEGCLVSGVLMQWYRGKQCVYCKNGFPELHWVDHRPALLDTEGKLLSWSEVKLDQLPNVLETHFPVCWNCYVTQTFRREHPDLVVFRDGSSASRQTARHQ